MTTKKEAAKLERRLKAAERKELAALVDRQRVERLNLSEKHSEMSAALLRTCHRQKMDLDILHTVEWFKHRRKYGYQLGDGALAALERGRA